jgi:hypothetical protein
MFIKKQIKTLRDIYDNQNPVVSEHIKTIKENYLIVEEDSPRDFKKYKLYNILYKALSSYFNI